MSSIYYTKSRSLCHLSAGSQKYSWTFSVVRDRRMNMNENYCRTKIVLFDKLDRWDAPEKIHWLFNIYCKIKRPQWMAEADIRKGEYCIKNVPLYLHKITVKKRRQYRMRFPQGTNIFLGNPAQILSWRMSRKIKYLLWLYFLLLLIYCDFFYLLFIYFNCDFYLLLLWLLFTVYLL